MRDPERFPPIKPEHAAAIGYVAAHWSLIEEQLGFIIYNLLDLHTIPGMAVTAELNTLQRMHLINALVSLTDKEDWIDRWGAIANTLDGLRNRRNDAIHSTWRVVGPDHWGTRIKAKGQVKIKSEMLPTKALEDLSTEILALVGQIDELALSLLQGGAGKIINQFHPPGWTSPTQAQAQSQALPSRTRNPKRERQQLSRAQRRAKALKAHKKK
jgi:hypothetical protein